MSVALELYAARRHLSAVVSLRMLLALLLTPTLVPPLADDKGKVVASEKEEGSSALDDDTLKCAICFDLCVRPVTVRLARPPCILRLIPAGNGAC